MLDEVSAAGPAADEAARLAALRSYRVLDTPPEPAFDDLARLAALVCGAPMALVTLVDAERQWFKAALGIEPCSTPRGISFCSHAIASAEPLVVPDTRLDARFADNPFVTGEPHVRFYAGAPLVTRGGHRLGTLCVLDDAPRTLTGVQLEALEMLARQVVDQLELRRQAAELVRSEESLRALAAELERQSHSDPLTGLPNRRAWDSRIDWLLHLMDRQRAPLTVAIVDLDHFRRYNDTHGHPAGDELLVAFARAAGRVLRAGDFVARWGGEEFAVALPNCTGAEATMVLERLRRAVPGTETASIGHASWNGAETAAQLVGRADAALRRAKQAGRNRVQPASARG